MSGHSTWAPFPSVTVPLSSLAAAIATLVTLLISYAAILVIYRLRFSPLADFPGPRMAACTQWYEAYYDLVADGGAMFTFHIQKLHEQYGEPLVHRFHLAGRNAELSAYRSNSAY